MTDDSHDGWVSAPAGGAGEGPFRIERRTDRAAVLWLDRPGRSVNTLEPSLDQPLTAALAELERDSDVEAVVLASGKEDSFVVGADIEVLREVTTPEQGVALSRGAQQTMQRLEDFPKPLVAAVHGDCLGGGLELALACDAVIASDADDTELGLPEVRLGLLPGVGGTQRLPRRVGLEDALELILTGRAIGAERARRIGLVDEVVHPAILLEVAAGEALRLAGERAGAKGDRAERRRRGRARSSTPGGHDHALKSLLLEENPIGRRLLFSQAEKRIRARTGGHMPAPLEALAAVRAGIEHGFQRGLEVEAESFGRLLATPESAALVDLFRWRRELQNENGLDEGESDVEPRAVAKVGVVGAGLMGTGIARITAEHAELPVRLSDLGHDPLSAGIGRLHRELDRAVEKKRMARREAERVLSRIRPTTGWSGFGRADVVVEAVVEDLEIKRRVLREAEGRTGERTVFASNTSSLPIGSLAEAATRPGSVVGMHYFSPVDRVPLLEVVRAERTDPEVVATAVELGKRQGKTVIVVRDGPGFYTTRILAPYLDEATRLLADGARIEEIDRALTDFGFPVGPLQLLDEVGLDVGREIAEVLHRAFGDRMAPSTVQAALADDERRGRKNGRGFYRYERRDGEWKRTGETDDELYRQLGVEARKETVPAWEIVDRCVLAMVNEAVRCLEDGIVRSERDAEVGAVFGLGFPPFRGGPLRYVDRRGVVEVVAALDRLAGRHGPRFAAAERLRAMARDGRFLVG